MREHKMDYIAEGTQDYIDTGIRAVFYGKPNTEEHNQQCAFCGYANGVHLGDVKISSTEVEASIEVTTDAIKIIDKNGNWFDIKLVYCPVCGAKMKGAGD